MNGDKWTLITPEIFLKALGEGKAVEGGAAPGCLEAPRVCAC